MALPLTAESHRAPEVVVMVGLRGCGKSTWVKRYLAGTHVVVSKDFWPEGMGRSRRPRAIAQALAAGLDVVVDDANPSCLERAAIIAIARRYGATVRAVFVDTPVADCLAHASATSIRSERTAGGPAGRATPGRRLVRPSREEGFERVDTVAPSRRHHDAAEWAWTEA